METANFWRGCLPAVFDEDVLERSFDLRCLAAEVLRVDDWDRALMAPKLSAKSDAVAAGASADAIFEARAVAAQIGWLETSLPAAAVEALCNVEMLLCSGFSERSMPIYHQLLVFQAWEHGLLATWETPDALICVARLPMIMDRRMTCYSRRGSRLTKKVIVITTPKMIRMVMNASRNSSMNLAFVSSVPLSLLEVKGRGTTIRSDDYLDRGAAPEAWRSQTKPLDLAPASVPWNSQLSSSISPGCLRPGSLSSC